MRRFVALGTAMVSVACGVCAEANAASRYASSQVETYSKGTLLKNWAISACLAEIATDPAARADANATAGAYLEFGRQPIETYEALRQLAQRYAQRRYSGSVSSEFNTMKCIDLFHSPELDALVKQATRKSAH